MTTVAFDGKLLAADGRACINNLIVGKRTQKIFTLKVFLRGAEREAVLSGAGSYQTLMQVKQCLEVMGDIEAPEIIPDIEPGAFQGILLIRGTDEAFYLEDRLVLTDVELPVALGSGMDYAMTALHLGKNAHGAVQTASDLDCYTGGEIRVFDIEKWDFVTVED